MNEELPPRERLLLATSDLMELQGYNGTGLNEIIRQSQTPKGSLYHYFPDGKEELAAETVRMRGQMVLNHIQSVLDRHDDPSEAVYTLLNGLADRMQHSQCQRGAPIASVALEASANSERLRAACDAMYSAWREAFGRKLVEAGVAVDVAARLASHIVSTIEGAAILSRTARDSQPVRDAAIILRDLIRNYST